MTYCGPNSQPLNFTHKALFTDYNGPEPAMCVNEGSIYQFIHVNPKFRRFAFLMKKAELESFYNETQCDCTLFAVPDDYINHIPENFFRTMDTGLAKQILKSCTLHRRLDKDLITSSPVSYFPSLNHNMRMYVTNISGKTQINNCMMVLQYDIQRSNGLIHIVSGLIMPSDDTFMN
jgi:hypothetical protein